MKNILNFTLSLILFETIANTRGYDIIKAVNYGGTALKGSNGVNYEADNVRSQKWTYKEKRVTGNYPPEDEYIYNQACYELKKLSLDVPIDGNGSYLLVLKLNEDAPDRTSTVYLNQIEILKKFSIEQEVGLFKAFDFNIYFEVAGNVLMYRNNETAKLNGQKVTLEIVKNKGSSLLGGLVMVKGDVENFPVMKSSWSTANKSKKAQPTAESTETGINIKSDDIRESVRADIRWNFCFSINITNILDFFVNMNL